MTAVAVQYEKLRNLGAEVLAMSADSRFSHKIWQEHELSKMVPGGVPFPMLSDPGGNIGRVYGVYDEDAAVNLRGRFLIDPDGIVQALEILAPQVGRSPKELVRQLLAFQHVRKTGEVTPSGWEPGRPTLKPGPHLVGKVWTVWKPVPSKRPADEQPTPLALGSVQRLHMFRGVYLASQPEPDDFRIARDAGIRTVLDLREKGERTWDEAVLVEKLGMEYHSLPFKAPDTLTDAVFDQARSLLNDRSKRPLLFHCSTANRVGAVWLAHRILDHGLSFEEALAESRQLGLELPAYIDRARTYIGKAR